MSGSNPMFKFSLEEVDLIEHAVHGQIAHLPAINPVERNENTLKIHQLMGILGTLYNQKIWYEQKQPPAVADFITPELISFDCWF